MAPKAGAYLECALVTGPLWCKEKCKPINKLQITLRDLAIQEYGVFLLWMLDTTIAEEIGSLP